ncbi:MAG: DNA-directed RNA polymerase subunit alpha C-terminal domain-containing protein [Planctomycetota bacterium]
MQKVMGIGEQETTNDTRSSKLRTPLPRMPNTRRRRPRRPEPDPGVSPASRQAAQRVSSCQIEGCTPWIGGQAETHPSKSAGAPARCRSLGPRGQQSVPAARRPCRSRVAPRRKGVAPTDAESGTSAADPSLAQPRAGFLDRTIPPRYRFSPFRGRGQFARHAGATGNDGPTYRRCAPPTLSPTSFRVRILPMTETSSNTNATLDRPPMELLAERIDHESLREFRRSAFGSLAQLERLRDWVEGPSATGARRGIALWALGHYREAIEELGKETANPTIADCLARAYLELGRFEDAEKALSQSKTDARQAATLLEVQDRRGDPARLRAAIEAGAGTLLPADAAYYRGRAYEKERDGEAAIAAFDEALRHDPNHPQALFRLAVNVDLRGEDEEARELYERALMHPPVNLSCVVNLGILYEDAGNYRRAMQCFDLALQCDPHNQRARLFRRDASAALNMYYDEDQERREDKRNKILRTPINDFELSVRSRNCLAKMNIRTLGDLVKKTEPELLSYKNFGETSLNEIKEILRNKGLRLGMTVEELSGRDFGVPEAPQLSPEEAPDPNSPDPARRPVTELDLSVRSRRIVDLLKIRTIGDLANKTEAELLACPNFGQTSLNEIKTKLDELGLSLRG